MATTADLAESMVSFSTVKASKAGKATRLEKDEYTIITIVQEERNSQSHRRPEMIMTGVAWIMIDALLT